MTLLDPQRLQDLVAGTLGGAVAGLYHFTAVVMAGATPSRADYIRLSLNMASAMVTGGLFAAFLSQALVSQPWVPIKDPSAISFGLGVLSWETLPAILSLSPKAAQWLASKFGGVR